MKVTGMKGLHEICKTRGAGLSMPDQTAIGDDIKIVLDVFPTVKKCDIRDMLRYLDDNHHHILKEAKIILQKDLK